MIFDPATFSAIILVTLAVIVDLGLYQQGKYQFILFFCKELKSGTEEWRKQSWIATSPKQLSVVKSLFHTAIGY